MSKEEQYYVFGKHTGEDRWHFLGEGNKEEAYQEDGNKEEAYQETEENKEDERGCLGYTGFKWWPAARPAAQKEWMA